MRLRLLCAVLLANLMAMLAHAGTVTGSIQRPNGQPLANGVVTFSLSQAGVTQSGAITVTSDNVYCGTSSTGTVVGITDPAAPAVLSANYGTGTLPATQYFVKFTYTAASGESAPSPETTFLMTSNGTLNGNAPLLQPGNATGYKVYIGTTSGGETLQQTVVGFSGWSQSVDLVVGAVAPVSNSTLCNTLIFNDAITPSYTTYLVNLLDSKGKQVAGYPQRYYFSGATLDLSTLAPAGNLYARFPTAIVAQPGGNGLQSIAGPLSLGTYPFTAGPITTSSVDKVLYVGTTQYPTIASALAAVPGSGASVIVAMSGYRETFTSHYDLGNGTTNAVILMMNNDVILTCNVTDASYCFNVHEASGIIGVRSEVVSVDRSGGSVISIASTANVANVIQTGENPQGSLTLSGFTIDNVNGGAVSNAVVNLVNLNDSSTIRDVKASYFPHMGLHISTTTGGVKSIGPLNIDNCYFDGVSRAGARPLVIESDGSGATNNVNVMGGFYLNAGSGLADIELNGGGNTQGALQQILISGVYTQQSAPSTAVTGIKIVDAAGVTVQTSSFQVTDATTGHTGISINQSGAGRTHSINVQNFRLDSGGGNIGLNNLITTTTVLNAVGTGNIPGYIYGGSAGTQTPSPFIFDSDTQLTLAGGNIARTAATGAATVDLASVASGACTADSSNVTLTGALVGDPVRVAAATALPAGVWLIGRVTAADTGRFQLCNLSGGAVDRASDTYTISVVK